MATSQSATARDIMHEGCRCIGVDETVLDAARRMANDGIGALPICGNDDRLKGMLTDRDIVVKCLAEGKDPNTCTAGELADDHIVWVAADASPREVLARMEEHQIRRLPVLDQDRQLVGIISERDVAQHLGTEQTGELVSAVTSGPPMQHPA